MTQKKIYIGLFFLILVSTLIRGFLAAYLELGNDEVYYWTYALYPDLSHFDHPPMVGFMIQAFSFNLIFDNELVLRMAALVFGAVNTWLIFLIGARIKNMLTGFYAAILYNTSIYCFIIAGTFILPDTPQLLFWLLGLYFLITSILEKHTNGLTKTNLIIAGLTIGLGMLSKYTTIFLWIGAVSYIVLYNRIWLKKKELYFSILVSFMIFIPVIVWNVHNNFISFTFQGERVNFFGSGINFDTFFQELGGQILYNNPVNFVLIIVAIIALLRGKRYVSGNFRRFLLWTGLPLILVFLAFALFRRTLPHWTGPGYLSLILLCAAYFAEMNHAKPKLFPISLQIPAWFLVVSLILGIGQVKGGWLYQSSEQEPHRLGVKDVSLDVHGWKQLHRKFKPIYENDLATNAIDSNAVIISYRWFPAANLDYYVAKPLRIKLLAIGTLERIHKYAWINHYRGGFTEGMDAYFITSSRDFKDPTELYREYFNEIILSDTIPITRGKNVAKNVFVYKLRGLKKIPEGIALK